ncbi:DNA internalization-related competence protein ComEC/Rec2 [Liberibacter crescens BT-1]|uniref:DNA internalization-related competence protein ComEC/Rec2 n=1 Tax=Liberibacter crescens (strain BT-1) TaxID=1215343 RepID=L0EWS1_LIBCB|nr:ComEC/Rec2 family competence protein [Liberibacter crescens]AGA65088.1 DNA internalization-related competence protein ComEC/Rec2 [Liberibacter crescens BT-1]
MLKFKNLVPVIFTLLSFKLLLNQYFLKKFSISKPSFADKGFKNKIYKPLYLQLSNSIKTELEYGRPFIFIPVFLAFGATLWFLQEKNISLSLIVTGFILSTISTILSSRCSLAMFLFTGAITCTFMGAILAASETKRKPKIMLFKPITVELRGLIEKREAMGNEKWRYLVKILDVKGISLDSFPQRAIISTVIKHKPFMQGKIIQGLARLSPPSGPVLPRLFDFRFFSYFKSIGANGYFYGLPILSQYTDKDPKPSLISQLSMLLDRARTYIGEYIRHKIPGDSGAFAAALVTDERRAISLETNEALRKSGLSHIIAISGLNMAIAAGLSFLGIRKTLSLFPNFTERFAIKKIAAFGALFTVTIYFLISGFSVSAQRAYLMTVITLISILLDRISICLHNIALTALVILFITPSEVMGPSFQMSFAATIALVASYTKWENKAISHPLLKTFRYGIIITGIIDFFKKILLTSLISSLATSLFLIQHFHNIVVYGFLANLAAIPLLSFIVIPAAFATIFLIPLSLDHIPLQIMGWGLELIIAIAQSISRWGNVIYIGRIPSVLFISLLIGFLILTLLKTALCHIGTIIIVLSMSAFFFLHPTPKPDLLISDNGRLVAFVKEDTLFTNRTNPPRFIFSQWQTALAAKNHQKPQKINNKRIPSEWDQKSIKILLNSFPFRQFVCIDKLLCTGQHETGTIISVIEKIESINIACKTSDVIVTAINIDPALCNVRLLITPKILRKSGSLEIIIIKSPKKNEKPTFVIKNSTNDTERPWRYSTQPQFKD